ncbi:L-serine ammonia-lyase [Arthrobacter subterraneus]|uniref:L-serine dehydratase n=1 Tax=Arthrobacter subterraneus TaxID=335973 RepID=A0A1G8HE24_9MICC|nr:L-serine ammonia-lyase [Arthrobacter subterraneus]SDI04730.1 L-serine ammonia-lyase [Arthrobacter subterraneus]
MKLSALDLFSIGIGPSSSHTVGPMRAARLFIEELRGQEVLERTRRVRAELFGSLGATGRGHGSDQAVVLGLTGEDPETVDTATAGQAFRAVLEEGKLNLAGSRRIGFNSAEDLILHRRKALPYHPNGMAFTAFDDGGIPVLERTFYSVGGGFVVDESAAGADRISADRTSVPYPFSTAAELLEQCARTGKPVSGIMLANELSWRTESELRRELLRIWVVMQECVANGCDSEGVLPGGLRVRRRAPQLFKELTEADAAADPLRAMGWVNLFALAVNEENAAGGRIVTAPTNGAAGIVPAVLHYYVKFVPGADDDGVIRFLLTAAAIGILFKENASISGAEVGCQGEVGSACSMAAGALCEVLGGSPQQVEKAAEMGIEHNLGLTCDPVGGLVQVPCIERNAIASIKAINSARLALSGDCGHIVSLDQAIRTMRDTGADMKSKYKETSRGGLAVNVPVNVTEC